MKYQVGIIAVLAISLLAWGGYASLEAEQEAVPESAQKASEQLQTDAGDPVALPWVDPTFQISEGGSEEVPCDSDEGCGEEAMIWCCRPNGTCVKMSSHRCVQLGGNQHPTLMSCQLDPQCC